MKPRLWNLKYGIISLFNFFETEIRTVVAQVILYKEIVQCAIKTKYVFSFPFVLLLLEENNHRVFVSNNDEVAFVYTECLNVILVQ